MAFQGAPPTQVLKESGWKDVSLQSACASPSVALHGVFCSAVWESCELEVCGGWGSQWRSFKDCIVEREEKELREQSSLPYYAQGSL